MHNRMCASDVSMWDHFILQPLKTALNFGLLDVPLHSYARIYATGNLGFQEFYRLKKVESFLSYCKRRAVTRVFYSRSVGSRRLAPLQLVHEEVYFIC